MIVVDILVNVCESMGANVINTVVETVAPLLDQLTGARIGIKILSNLCTERMASCEFEVPVK